MLFLVGPHKTIQAYEGRQLFIRAQIKVAFFTLVQFFITEGVFNDYKPPIG